MPGCTSFLNVFVLEDGPYSTIRRRLFSVFSASRSRSRSRSNSHLATSQKRHPTHPPARSLSGSVSRDGDVEDIELQTLKTKAGYEPTEVVDPAHVAKTVEE